MNNQIIDSITGWADNEINDLELTFLHEIFECKDKLAVDAAISYARYISDKIHLNPDNYPVFMLLLESENHWVVDALIGDNNPDEFFKSIQPNRFLLTECFKMLTRWKKDGIYPKSLLVIFGLIKVAYEKPAEGYRIYPLSISDLNNMGKYLDDSHDQKNSVNSIVLSLLDKIANLVDPGIPITDNKILEVATQANNIRGKFLDITKHLNEAIPDLLLEKGNYAKNEVTPSRSTK